MINKHCYGAKSPETPWNRLILDLKRASEALRRTIAELREITSGLKVVFLAWWRQGEYSVNGHCFDIGTTTRNVLRRFEKPGVMKVIEAMASDVQTKCYRQ